MPKRVITGVVKSDKMDKTRVVQVVKQVPHPKYGKIVRKTSSCYTHDENNESAVGDTVEIVEARPTSKSKRWSLVRVVEKSRLVDLSAMRAARKEENKDEAADAGGKSN